MLNIKGEMIIKGILRLSIPAVVILKKAIYGYGNQTAPINKINYISNIGVIENTTTTVGQARRDLAAASYGGDKAIFGYGGRLGTNYSLTNLVSNTGVVSANITGVGTARSGLAAASYGFDKAIFGFGVSSSVTNLVSNIGVVSTDTAGVGTARFNLAAASFGNDKAIFGFGTTYSGGYSYYSLTNLVSNVGVVATDTTGVGTSRRELAAVGYGGDKAIFGFGINASGVLSMTNLVSNAGIVSTDTTGVGTARSGLAAASYGADLAVFIVGGSFFNSTNLVSNTGVVSTDSVAVANSYRTYHAAAAYGS